MLNVLRRMRHGRQRARELYGTLVSRARAPEFFTKLGVPDTLDGRFDTLTLHTWLVLARLKELGAQDVAQRLTDAIFVGFDEGLRDIGAGDIGIGHRVKKMANAFYGRLKAYDAATDEAMLVDTLLRNLYRGVPDRLDQAVILARYVDAARKKLAATDLTTAELDFGPLP